VVGDQGKNNMIYSLMEVHSGCMMLKVLHHKLGFMKAHVHAQELPYLVGVKDECVSLGCVVRILEEEGQRMGDWVHKVFS
jgi:hypothetical protein